MDRTERAKALGRWLTDLRDIRPKTKVAKAIGISYSSLCKYETGLRTPSPETLERITAYYGVKPEDFYFACGNH